MKKVVRAVKSGVTRVKPQSKQAKIVCLILVALIGGMVGYAVFKVIQDDKRPDKEPVITYSTNQPDESKANADNYKWTGAPDEPKRITIKSINVNAYIQQAGVDQNKQVAVPNNVHLAGWFNQSMKPGEKGLAIIAGHVSGRTTDGVFKQLGQMQTGDSFEIERGDGKILKYKVFAKKQIDEAKSADILFSQDPKVTSQVNLITCGGQFDRGNQQYKDRIIVSAELIK